MWVSLVCRERERDYRSSERDPREGREREYRSSDRERDRDYDRGRDRDGRDYRDSRDHRDSRYVPGGTHKCYGWPMSYVERGVYEAALHHWLVHCEGYTGTIFSWLEATIG